jgi:hypothetical protein
MVNNKDFLDNTLVHTIFFTFKKTGCAISLNATINNNDELIHQN